MPEPDFDEKLAHRWFAVKANNLAWPLVEASTRTAAETSQMIEAAHAAIFHWSQVGTALNLLRAEVLLATAWQVAGNPKLAMGHAQRALEHAESADSLHTAFDTATVHGCLTLLMDEAGQIKERDHHEQACKEALEQLNGAEGPDFIRAQYLSRLNTS